MTGQDQSLAEAKARADSARLELRAAADTMFGWFSPDRLKSQAAMAATHQIDEARAALRRSVTHHPLVSWSALSAIAALFAYLLRRPALGIARASIDSFKTLRKKFVKRK